MAEPKKQTAAQKKAAEKKASEQPKGFGEPVVFKGDRFDPFEKVAVKFTEDFRGFRKGSVHTMHVLMSEKYLNKEGVPAVKVDIPKGKTIQEINESDIPRGGQA